MPSSSTMRPSSPLSPRSSRHDTLQLPPRSFHARPSPTQCRKQAVQATSLMLPALPRFHPANFPSNDSSLANTPGSGLTSPQPPSSPQKLYTDAQQQLFLFRETLAGRVSPAPIKGGPISPKLVPAGSPGPVTPLELEEGDSYITSGPRAVHHRSTFSDGASELTAKLNREAAQRESSPRSSSSPGRGR